VAEQLGITALLDSEVAGLSAGEVQRVAIARALVLEPEILFLDEPTANLDAEIRVALREDLERVARTRARSTILATHDRTEAFYLADRIAVLSAGRAVQIGSPSELFEHPVDPYIAAVTGAEFSLRGVVTGTEGGVLHIRIGDATFTTMGAADRGEQVKVAYRPEDIFLSREELEGGSPRNRFRAKVLEVRDIAGLLRVRLEGPAEIVAVVTRAAGEELGLEPGLEVAAQVKATALHAFRM
jgi:molybdopterin-binding protein